MTVYDSLVIIDPLILTNQDNNYILQHQDVYDLQKYLWSDDVIKPLVDVYQICELTLDQAGRDFIVTTIQAQSQCQSFYQDTFRGKLPKLTDDALTYAQKAADGSYAPIFQDIIDINSAATDEELKRLQDDLTTRISDHYDAVLNLQTKASSCADDLRKFEQQTREYQSSLKQCVILVHDRTVRELGEINELQNKVKKCREEIKTDTEEYEHDKLVACTTPSYAWLGFVGLIAASTIAGVYGKKAADMAARLDELNDELDRYEGDLKDESSIIADLTAIDGDLEGLLDIIGPAIVVVEKMEGVWQSFAGDFYSMLSEITQVRQIRLSRVWWRRNWKLNVKEYKQAMDVSLPISAYGASVSIDEISRQLHAQANKWGALEANI
ncbi:hypothetical protein K523DRAFT_351394 [Schizophyllum commune Tattone D]|nr:hypothetical protein K523DRAFT_351394 [Schizophyllum commune Tattone D]